MIEMMRRYWLEVCFVFVHNMLLVVLNCFVFFRLFCCLLIMEWSAEKNEMSINMYPSSGSYKMLKCESAKVNTYKMRKCI